MDKELLFKSRLPEQEIEIEGLGTVRVRALSRAEALRVNGVELAVEVAERKMLALACVDPVLTEDEVRQWQEASGAGELEPVVETIARMSGMKTERPKETMHQF